MDACCCKARAYLFIYFYLFAAKPGGVEVCCYALKPSCRSMKVGANVIACKV